MEKNLVNINCEHICLLGDLNSRSGNLDDVLISNYHSDIGVELNDIQLPNRISKDLQTNTMGYELISYCKANQVAIVNGRLGDDKGVGNLTCKDASVVDYIIVSHSLFEYALNFKVHPFNELFSDCHNAISIEFKLESRARDATGESEWEDLHEENTL